LGAYYYLMAQLPGLAAAGPTPITYGRFAELAGRFLSGSDRSVLDRLSLEPPREPGSVGSPLVDAWYERERALRLSLARARAAKRGRAAALTGTEESLGNRFGEVAAKAHEAMALDDPLEAERLLDRLRLDWLNILSVGHYYDAEAVFAYGLAILLREREDRFSVDAGRASYIAVYNQILGDEA